MVAMHGTGSVMIQAAVRIHAPLTLLAATKKHLTILCGPITSNSIRTRRALYAVFRQPLLSPWTSLSLVTTDHSWLP